MSRLKSIFLPAAVAATACGFAGASVAAVVVADAGVVAGVGVGAGAGAGAAVPTRSAVMHSAVTAANRQNQIPLTLMHPSSRRPVVHVIAMLRRSLYIFGASPLLYTDWRHRRFHNGFVSSPGTASPNA